MLFIDHDTGRSGSTVSLEYLVKAFKEEGYIVFIHTPKKKEEHKKTLMEAGANLIEMRGWNFTSLALSLHFTNITSPFSIRGVRTNIKEIIKFFMGILISLRVIRETRPDLVYVNEYVVIQASLAAYFSRIPAVIHIRSPLLQGVFGIRRYVVSQLILKYNDAIFAITSKEADQLRARGKEFKKLKLVGEFFSEMDSCSKDKLFSREAFGLPNTKKVVTMLGGIQSIKGTLDFLRGAYSVALHRDDVVFVVAGREYKEENEKERVHYQECMRIVESSQMNGAVVILGEIINALELVAISDIIVSPSSETHFARPVVEAWGLAKPVIATKTEHMLELMADRVNGLLVDVGDHEALAKSILLLMEDEKLARSLGNEGKRNFTAEFLAVSKTRIIVETCDNLIAH